MLKDLFYDGKKTASCTTLMKWAKQKKQFVTSGYKAGDVIFYDWDSNKSDSEHTGIFTGEISNGRLVIIEGNTGDAVKEKLQYTSLIIGAWRPQYESKAQIDAIITWAYAQIGTAENPVGTNNVIYNTLYYGRAVSDPTGNSYQWCMSFVWCAFNFADKYIKDDAPQTAKIERLDQLPILRKGSKGRNVKNLQNILLGLGYSLPVYGADGEFGSETERAVKQYQIDNNLEADGEVWVDTYATFFIK